MAKFETKYDIGDTVWFTSQDPRNPGVVAGEIIAVQCGKPNRNQRFYMFSGDYYGWYAEDTLYRTRKEARANFIKDAKARYENLLCKYKKDLEGHETIVKNIRKSIDEVEARIKELDEEED